MKLGGLGAVLGLGRMSEEWENHRVWRARKMSVVLGDNSSCGHRIPEVTSGGTHGWIWRDKSRATVGKQRQPPCSPGKSWCKRCFWINTLKTSIFKGFHIFRGKIQRFSCLPC